MSEPNSGLGRRGEAVADAARVRIVKASAGQSRRTRRNNLRLARLENRAPAVAAKAEARRRAEARAAHEAAGTAT